MLVALALVAVVPVTLDQLGLGVVGRVVAQVVRWVLLVGVVIVGLAVVYRVAPNRADARFSWVSTGAVVATVLWILGSVAFSLYVSFFGSYNKTYGALAGVIVLMLWLYLTCYIVLLGAEINAESERQTRPGHHQGPADAHGPARRHPSRHPAPAAVNDEHPYEVTDDGGVSRWKQSSWPGGRQRLLLGSVAEDTPWSVVELGGHEVEVGLVVGDVGATYQRPLSPSELQQRWPSGPTIGGNA